MSHEVSIEIRDCNQREEFERCVELQRQVWNFSDLDLVPTSLFVVAKMIGGQVLGAYRGSEMLGFVFALPACRENQTYLHSHMAAVLPAYQGQGIGRLLKLRQRAEALAAGFSMVEWTFDPLVLRNAHFNINRLGVIARHYVTDKYGPSSSPLHGTLPTDRLLVEWWIASPRVESVLAGHLPRARGPIQTIELPADIDELRHRDPATARRWQSRAREQFEGRFQQGYAVTGFALGPETGTYVLEPYAG
jgi:predicted GNAT superfamily acetyltransferase